MSAFIVSQSCMNRIISGLYFHKAELRLHSEIYNEQKLHDNKDFCRLGNRLFKLNQMAIIQRYGDETEQDREYAKIEKFMAFPRQNTLIDCLKAMECLHYQCSEGNVPRKKLYRWLTKTIEAVQSHIVHNLPEYEAAEWG